MYDSDENGNIIKNFEIPMDWYSSGNPIILCHEQKDSKGMMEFYCPYCHRIHRHGRGNGHRSAHCDTTQMSRWGNKEIETNSPYNNGGYIIILAYLYNKDKVYSQKPKITIDTKRNWSTIYLNLDSVNKKTTYSALNELDIYMEQYKATRTSKSWFKLYSASLTSIRAIVRPDIQFYVAQKLLEIANKL